MNMKEVFVVGGVRLPFAAVDQVGAHNFKNYLRKRLLALVEQGLVAKEDVGLYAGQMYISANQFLEKGLKDLEATTGLTIKAEYPPNEGSFAKIPAADLVLVMLESLFNSFPAGKLNLRELIEFFYLGSVISHKTDENAVHAFAKVIALRAGMNRANGHAGDMACSSGLKAISFAYNEIAFHGADFAIGGGIEKMSGVPDRLVRFGLTNPFDQRIMAGLTDETAKMFGLTREELDDYAFESRQRALAWQGKHRFIAPVRVDENLTVERDEEVDAHPMARDRFSRTKTYPKSEEENAPRCEMITAGNSAAYADGGGIVLLASADGVKYLKKIGVKSMAKILAYEEATGSDPKSFVLRPGEAIAECLKNAGLPRKNTVYHENNEAFAAGNKLLMNLHNIPRDRINRRGGAIAHGHAIGGTTGALVVKAADIAEYDKEKYFTVSACHAVDSASAMLFENLNV